MESALSGVSVMILRQWFSKIRKEWASASPAQPFCPWKILKTDIPEFQNASFESIALKFIFEHQLRRTVKEKSAKKKKSSDAVVGSSEQ